MFEPDYFELAKEIARSNWKRTKSSGDDLDAFLAELQHMVESEKKRAHDLKVVLRQISDLLGPKNKKMPWHHQIIKDLCDENSRK